MEWLVGEEADLPFGLENASLVGRGSAFS